MFTGLVEAIGTIRDVSPRSGSTRLGIDSPIPAEELEQGESVAVDGVCLTVSAVGRGKFYADAVAETLSRTTLSARRPGHKVNLERALRLGDRVGGHMVQGHVDGTARVREVRRRGDDWRVRVGLPGEIRRYVAEKGSIAVQGVSLTVSAVAADGFEVALVPTTLERTTLGALKAGDAVNLEVDLLARYLESWLGDGGSGRTALRKGIRIGHD